MLRVGIDAGGTNTDLVAIDEQGGIVISKRPSTVAAPSRSDQVAGASPQTPSGKEVKMQELSCRFMAASEDVVDTFFAHDFGALPIHSVIQSSERLFVSDRCHWDNFNTSWFKQRQPRCYALEHYWEGARHHQGDAAH